MTVEAISIPLQIQSLFSDSLTGRTSELSFLANCPDILSGHFKSGDVNWMLAGPKENLLILLVIFAQCLHLKTCFM